ncbi:MAG TPA: phenylalanine--tRNA ligase subunit beta [Nocardioidaceae bacterium]|nr:phenylalanine--tRNA ligase subunit beta [Nocardioidaceae bacterium]
MRAPVSWIREYVDLPADLSTEDLAARLTALGLKLEALERHGADIRGPLVVGRVVTKEPEPQKNGKTINWCTVDVGAELNAVHGTSSGVGIVCGAHNFEPGDLVVVVLPGGVLPGGFEISARKTYGHLSSGMICSATELGLEDPATKDGIVVLPPDAGEPGDDAFGVLPLREDVIEFEINPDRAYALSLRGVAREAALGFDAAFRDPAERDTPVANDAGYPIRVEDPDGCPVFVTRTVTGFDPTAPTPRWLARRVQLAGMRPISLAVDITNYVMLELGQPIHGYDGDRLQGPVVVRRARPGERLTTLDGVRRTLSAEDLLITDDSGPIGLAGVMGGEHTELSATTSHVVIEAAHFDPVSIFRTERRHKLPSEASKRFERGVDPRLPEAAADRVAELLVRYGGGTIGDGVTKVGEAPASRTVRMAGDLPARVMGMAIDADTTIAHLRAVGCVVSVDGGELSARVPSWRPDLNDPFDLVEEVARIVGYEQIPSVLPQAPAGRGLTTGQGLRRRVGRTLAGAGFVEVVSFPFVGEHDLDRLGLPADDERRRCLRLANPISSEEPWLTTTLLPGVLKATARNVGRGIGDVALFETGAVIHPRGESPAPILPVDRRPTEGEWDDLNKALPDQPNHLVVVVAGNREPAGWWGPARAGCWADAIQTVREVAAAVGVPVEVRAAQQAPWHPGRCAEIRVGDTVIGHAGELHPRVCTDFGVPPRTAAAEIDLDVLLEHAVTIWPAPKFSTYPVAKEDVALVVDAALPAAELARTLREGAGALCEGVRLFDVYTGDQVGAGRKSLAFSLRFRAPDRTLTEAEAGAARDAAVALAAERHGAVQRT